MPPGGIEFAGCAFFSALDVKPSEKTGFSGAEKSGARKNRRAIRRISGNGLYAFPQPFAPVRGNT
jgi:hypothetical protein